MIVAFFLCALPPLFAMSADANAPSSASIHQTLEQLWSGRQYRELTAYVEGLERSWGDYAPILLARALHSYQYGAQIEVCIDRLHALRTKIQSSMVYASPIFMELLDSRILRYEKLQKFYLEQGITPEKRRAERDPLVKTKFIHSDHWGEEMLFFNTPEVFITPDGIKPARERPERLTNSVLERADMPQLIAILSNEENDMLYRKVASQEIVRRRAAKGGVAELVNSLRLSDMSYTSQDTADALVAIGRDAVPLIVNFMNQPQRYSGDQMLAIWVLVRIGIKDASVMQALQSVATNKRMFGAQRYAKDAMQYLENIEGNGIDNPNLE